MGWSFLSSMHSKTELIAHLTGPNLGPRMKTVAKCVKGNVLWAVHEYLEASSGNETGKRWIGCYLMGVDQGWWGYKDMDESMGPTDVSCPLSYLSLVTDPGGHATAWRERVKAHHAKAAQFKGLTVGTKVKLVKGLTVAGSPLNEAIITSLRPLNASCGHITIRLPKKYIESIL